MLIVLGLALFVVSVVMIGYYESVLADEGLSQQEIWDSEWYLSWWKDFSAGFGSPATALTLSIVGALAIFYAVTGVYQIEDEKEKQQ